MVKITSLSLLFSTLSLLVVAQYETHVIHESRPHSLPSSSWSLTSKAPSGMYIPLRIGLKQNNIDRLHDELMAVSHPDSKNYGKHWSPQEVADFFRPTEETSEVITDWLNGEGLDGRYRMLRGGHWVEVNMTIGEAERLLQSEYNVYHHQSGTKHIACNSYSVPKHVQPHIELITPTIHFDAIHKRPKLQDTPPLSPSDDEESTQDLQPRALHKLGAPGSNGFGPKLAPSGFTPKKGFFGQLFEELKNCDLRITPNCLRALYGVFYPFVTQGAKNSYAIVEYTPQAYVPSDLDIFFKNYSKESVGTRPKLVSIAGGVVQTTDTGFEFNGESNLDLEYAMALVGPKQPVTLYQVGDLIQGASFNNLLDALDASYCTYLGGDDPTQDGIYPNPAQGGYKKKDCGTTKPANVISTSYGYNEADLSYFYTHRQCYEYGKLGLLGTTVLYSSGDFGVAGNGGDCLNPDGSQSGSGKRFNPSFPGGCPFVTSVGATQINKGKGVLDPESACERVIFSGGGFSNFFEAPDYQKNALATYFRDHKPSYTSAQYNDSQTSRGFPDLSANGANYTITVGGKFGLVYGTSASAPVIGALLTLINDARLAIGKGPVGFINPTIYSDSFKGAFKDIVSGGNQGCGTAGFTAVNGWDPVTGLGTPNFPALWARWLALP